jgi:hypothetical protein
LLVLQETEGRPHDVRAVLGGPPGERVRLVLDADLHQLVPGRMKLNLVDAVAEAVVGPQDGRIAIGLKSPGDDLCAAGHFAEPRQPVETPGAPLAGHGLAQRDVAGEEVVVLEGRRLVLDAMRLQRACRRILIKAGNAGMVDRGHGRISSA